MFELFLIFILLMNTRYIFIAKNIMLMPICFSFCTQFCHHGSRLLDKFQILQKVKFWRNNSKADLQYSEFRVKLFIQF